MTDFLWDVATAFEEDERKNVENIINTKAKGHNIFYIWKTSRWEGQWDNVIKTTYKLYPQSRKHELLKILGTKCWKVNRHAGTCELLWELPQDIIIPDGILDLETANEGVFNSGKSIAPAIMLS